MYIYTLALTPSNNWMGACGLHALVDPIARSMPFSMFGHKFGHNFGHNFGRNCGQTEREWSFWSGQIEPWCFWRPEMEPWGTLDHQMPCFPRNLEGPWGVPDANLVQFS